ncbi:MAG: DUF3575 domain-containing protein [Bacteroidota bacterium]
MSIRLQQLLFLFLILCFSMETSAQSSAIKTGPVGYAFGFVGICYEKVLSDHGSFQATLNPYNKVKDYDGTSYGASLEYRLYITNKEVLNGFYISPNIGFTLGNLTEQDTTVERNANAFHLVGKLGYQWIWTNNILVDLSLGPKFSFGQDDSIAPEFDGTHPDVNFAIGYIF